MDPNECGPSALLRFNSKDLFIAIDATCNNATCMNEWKNTLFGKTFVKAEKEQKKNVKEDEKQTHQGSNDVNVKSENK